MYVDPAAYLRLISPIACAAVRKVASQAVPAPVQVVECGGVSMELGGDPKVRVCVCV